ncbi:hypothetical protein K2173_026271 [Erythroxylum novogranatense]|uniref:RING-type domain-containing protein n=1 Tax=Erythroxylum novogranatense TaxID=1862640 RepID=A0AAV8SBP4_9ROSI|nr:hypothetical protein K2173_026271 [Erythroxylum novogranatense]
MPSSTKATVDHHLWQQKNAMDGGDGVDCHRRDGDQREPPSSGVPCTICLDLVCDNGGRSRAKLQCGHEFHLDCIGSAFNMKGAMQCPCCQTVEGGQWLYANGSTRSSNDFSMDDWIPEDEFYNLSYPEMPLSVHWCPFGELARVGPSFEDGEPPSTTYRDSRGHYSMYSETSAASPVAHSFVAYIGPISPASSRSAEGVDDVNFNQHWIGLPGRNEIFSTHNFPATNIQYHSWGFHSPSFPVSNSQISSRDPASISPFTLRSSNGDSDTVARPNSFPHPILFGSGSVPAAGSSFFSSIIPRHPATSVWTRERIQMSYPLHRQLQPNNSTGLPAPVAYGVPTFDGPRGLHMVMAAPPTPHEQSGGFLVIPSPSSSGQNLHEEGNSFSNHYQAWERDHSSRFQHASPDRDSRWHTFHQTTSGSYSGNRAGGFWRRQSS